MNDLFSDSNYFDDELLILKDQYSIAEKEARNFIDKAFEGGEFLTSFEKKNWLRNRFIPNFVLINEEEYANMCIDALKIVGSTAGTDYGTSRQRDLGQLGADMTRGYLGELAFSKYLETNWNIKATLGHEKGELREFLYTDIKKIRKENDKERKPNINIGIKTGKSNGIWLDITGKQFLHSDVHIFVKVATGRDHLFSFFKYLSVFKDKILKKGEDIGLLTKDESVNLFDNIPSFEPIPAYICGFVERDIEYKELDYSGKKGRKNYTINSWKGPYSPEDVKRIKEIEHISGSIKFNGIGDFSSGKRYLFNTGNLKWERTEWERIINQM